MKSMFEEIPHRIFLDSSILQTLQKYGGFVYEYETIEVEDRIYRDQNGITKLEALRSIMRVSERAPFEFALSNNSLNEVRAKGDACYLQWAYDVLDHWLACLENIGEVTGNVKSLTTINSNAYNYLGHGDRALLIDALRLGCDAFLTFENRLPKNANHIKKTLGLQVLSPAELWDLLRPWAALFY
jgi:hypothetical protein